MPYKFILMKSRMETRALPRLSGFTVLEFEGPEAAAFLQAQTMNDVLALTPGQWHWNGWLNPKGRVIALFALLRSLDEQFLAILPDFPAAELLPRLQRFVFRAKLRLRVADDLACAADFDPSSSRGPVPVLDFSGDGGRRSLRLLPAASDSLADPDPDTDAHWLGQDLAHGLPRLPESQREAWTPQMLSLDRLRAYSLKKGCYPGQEIVARTHYLGQAKRNLVRLAGTSLHAGMEIRSESGRALGNLVCATNDGQEGLAVMAAAGNEILLADGRPVSELPILEGLGRPL
jgi:folate-binding protein YgfZ